jgi:dsDNA-specific endonuclease/ATPase MutS2
MATKFEIGDIVETLDDNISGKIISIDSNGIKILSEDFFEMTFSSVELIKKPIEDIPISNKDLEKVILSELSINKTPRKTNTKTPRILEIDLHIHELIDDARYLSNFEILNIQLKNAKNRLEWAIKKRMKSIVFIHGVGQGVLREELYTLFRRYDNLEYFDADYQTYGVGATEVRIY